MVAKKFYCRKQSSELFPKFSSRSFYGPTLHCSETNNILFNSSLQPFQEVFAEMEEKYGEVEEMNVCDNLGDHLVGNVYVKVSIAPKSKWSHHYCIYLVYRDWCVLLVFYISSSVMKRTLRRPWLTWITGGLTGSPSMLSSLLSQTSEKLAVASMKWGECSELRSRPLTVLEGYLTRKS